MSNSTTANKRYLSSGRWRDKVSNHRQLGGIEIAVLDDGRGRGTRIAWVNTGGGLRFKVVPDRGMDIAEAFYHQYSLSWISHLGVTPPNPAAVRGTTWLDSFGGGLLATCGLTHVGGPEEDNYGVRGLHDRISHTPASMVSVRQPDLSSDQPEMSLTGKMIQSTVFGPHLELKRTISAILGEPVIRIRDEVTNLGNKPAPHMLLYHMNFGWPLVDEGADIVWEGDWEAPNEQSKRIFHSGNDFKQCSAPLDEHRGDGEAVAFIDAVPDAEGNCRCGIANRSLGLGVELEFSKAQLPWLTNWQHWGQKEYVMALEPGTHPPIGQAAAREEGSLIQLEAGERRTYDVTLTVDGIGN